MLLGTTDGRIVVSESIRVFPTAKAAKQFVAATTVVVRLRGLRHADSFNRVFAQYPTPPPLPTFAPTVERAGTTTTGSFEGTSAAAPLSGVAAVITWSNYVAEAAIRIAVPKPGELAALSQSVLRSASYTARAATGAATDPKLSQQADAVATAFLANPTSAPYAFAPAGRAGVPTNPPSCEPMTDAYVDSGVNAAARTFAGQDAATHIAARPEIIVYPKPADADRFRNYYRDLSTCLSDLYKSGLAAGSTVDVQRIPKRGRRCARRRAPARRPSRTSRRSREPTAPNWARRRSRWSRCETAPRGLWRSSCRPTRTRTSRPRWPGSSAIWERRSPRSSRRR